MKLKYIFPVLASVCVLTACGSKKEADKNVTTYDSAATTTVSATSVTTTKLTTTSTVTTTKKVDPPADLVLTGMDSVEVYSEISLDSFVTERNVELMDGSTLLNTADTGVYEVDIPYTYNGGEFTKKLTYAVVDTTAPTIINSGWDLSHKVGTDFDLNNYVGFADNFDKYPSLTYTGTVDPDTVGAYPLTATVTDSYGNSTSWDLTINVVEEVPKGIDNNPRVNYSDFIQAYQGENRRFGIDVSVWQTDVDYNAVRDAGCSFVMIRVGYYYSEITLDDYFKQNLENATAAGLDVGVYFYTTDNTIEGVREHARWIAEQLNGHELQMPVAFDWEEFANFQKYGMSINDINDVYEAFADETRKLGYTPILYSSKNFLNNIWSERSKSIAPVWLAHFVDSTDYTGEYAIWQASAYGHIPGINGDVDMDIQYMDKPIS
ncbi:MAG: glycoside hydrolase family 25 [Ruminococcus sp.]|uniref:GH25 family lysozyme n=1 Tax=Ruminococcus sp. TaxID=41978 RepID=UPI0025FFD2BA|nr:GH25 family lysozyme [Ruminococcus sp.]MBR5683364.1 glycoside hydrolase family 25 [Ruminococcus sp.]